MDSFNFKDVAETLFGIEFSLQGVFQTSSILGGIYAIFLGILKIPKYRNDPITTPFSSILGMFFIGTLLIGLGFISMKL